MKEFLTKKYGNVVEGPMGFRMPEHTARIIESATKSLPKDFTFRRVAKSADTEADPDERADVSIISTDSVDRDEEVLLSTGGDWAQFKKNPVVTFDHNYDELPAGSCAWMKVKANSIIAKTLYPTKPDDWGDAPWLPSAVLHMLRQDPPVCAGKSIGFLALNVRAATSEEKSRRPEWKSMPIIDKWIGLEYAVTPMPCNPDATTLAVSKSAEVDDHVIELVTKSFNTILTRLKKKSTTSGDPEPVIKLDNFQDTSAEALKEAARRTAEQIPFMLIDEYRWALYRRLELGEEHKEVIQNAIIEQFDRALGLV